MTVIAWDGKTLAADKRSTCVGHPSTVTKVHRVPEGIVGVAGNAAHCMALVEWFRNGRDSTKWPKSMGDDTADVLFISSDKKILMYCGSDGPYPTLYEDRFAATGSGRDYALAAMHLGKTAQDAVEVACSLDVNCGNGIDTLELESES